MTHTLTDQGLGSFIGQYFGGYFQSGLINQAVTLRLVTEERLDFLPQGFVTDASFGEECGPPLRGKLERGAVKVADFFVSFRRHHDLFYSIPEAAMPAPDSKGC